MKKTIAIMMGLAVAGTALTLNIASADQAPAAPPCQDGQGKNCPNFGQGKGRQGEGGGKGMQFRRGQGQGQGQGKGFRGGPRDGSGPRRDGSGGQCPRQGA